MLASMSNDERQIRYAVVGAGNIAQVAVLPAFAHAKDNSKLVALVSSDAEKRRQLGERYELDLQGDYSELESVIERGRIDAVYIATPNALHKDLAIRAAEAGAHVLCEKPLAPTARDCRLIMEACANNGVWLMVAYRLHFEEASLKALEIARSGQLGEPRLFSAFFTHVVREDDIRRDPGLAGGASLDLGVYCINSARQLFGAEPKQVSAQLIERNGTDDTVSATLTFPGQRIAQFCISNSVAGVSSYRIAGSEGDLRVEPAYEYVGELVHYLTRGDKTERKAFKKGDQFAPELKYFSECILTGRAPEPSGEEGWCDVRVVEAILESARSQRPVTLEPYVRRQRPSIAQADHERPVKKPELIRAPGPSVK
jgi:predicted dehydrogenase